jgi:hypothetical protein
VARETKCTRVDRSKSRTAVPAAVDETYCSRLRVVVPRTGVSGRESGRGGLRTVDDAGNRDRIETLDDYRRNSRTVAVSCTLGPLPMGAAGAQRPAFLRKRWTCMGMNENI